MRNAHCSHCGVKFNVSMPFPRQCGGCKEITYINPAPVVEILVPVGEGLLVIRRNIEPKLGQLAIPGGYMNMGETWQKGCSRELQEETGLVVRPEEITLFDVQTGSNGHLLVFGLAPCHDTLDVSRLKHDHEVSEITVIYQDHFQFEDLAFPTHTAVARKYFEATNGGLLYPV